MMKIKIVIDFLVNLMDVEVKKYDIIVILLIVMIDGIIYVEDEMIMCEEFIDKMVMVKFLLKMS